MNIIHERADGTIVTSMSGVKAPARATAILQRETFAEVLRREEHKLNEKISNTTTNGGVACKSTS